MSGWWSRNERREAPQILSDGSQNKLVLGAPWATKPKPTKPQDAVRLSARATNSTCRASWSCRYIVAQAPRLSRGLNRHVKDLATHEESDLGGGQRLLTFGQRIEPEIRVRQHFEQIARGGAKAHLRLL